jgi:hypothetical protein
LRDARILGDYSQRKVWKHGLQSQILNLMVGKGDREQKRLMYDCRLRISCRCGHRVLLRRFEVYVAMRVGGVLRADSSCPFLAKEFVG